MLSKNREGIILYTGEVHFAKGIWVGLELVNGAIGSHDGIVEKKRYFQVRIQSLESFVASFLCTFSLHPIAGYLSKNRILSTKCIQLPM